MKRAMGHLGVCFAIAASSFFALLAPSAALAAPGGLDPSFGTQGLTVIGFGAGSNPASRGNAIARQPDGKLVVAGSATDPDGNLQLLVTRLNPNGTLDAGFGAGGAFKAQLGAGSFTLSYASAVSLQPDGKIVIAGEATDSSSAQRVFVARLTPSGDLDPAFASNGVYFNQFGTGPGPASNASGLALQPDGKIVIAGQASDSSGSFDLLVARLTTGGTLDASFGAGGAYINQFGVGSQPDSSASSVALLPDGRILVAGGAGDFSTFSGQALVARLTSSGALDPSFASGGAFLGQFSSDPQPTSYASALAIPADGGVVIAGSAGQVLSGNNRIFVARLSPTGSLDTGFGSGGAYEAQLGEGSNPDSESAAVATQPDGKVLVGGLASTSSGGTRPLVARLDRNGSLDPLFGSLGVFAAQLGAGGNPSSDVFDLALQPDGAIDFVGLASDASGHNNLLAGRLLGNPGPTAVFTHSPARARVGVRTSFNATGSTDAYDPIVVYGWSFGDGTRGSGVRSTHTYKKPGTYTVTLAVLDADGLYSISRQTITTAKPAITKATQSHKQWREANKRARLATPTGTTFTIALNETSKLTLTFKQGKHSRGTLAFKAHPGTNRIHFYGRLKGKHRLPTGSYTLTITATSGSQRASGPSVKFTIVP